MERSGNDRRKGDGKREVHNIGRRQNGAKDVSTLFVDNLPWSMSVDWFRQIFKYEGELVDVFPKVRKFNKNRFGFVRFGSNEEATKVAERMNGISIWGCKIQMNMARYERMNCGDIRC